METLRVGDKVCNPNGMIGEVVEITLRNNQPVVWAVFKMVLMPCPMKCDYKPEQLRKVIN
jgi:hypothetical protein